MALVNELASQSNGTAAPLQGIGNSVTQGLDAAVGFAAAKQKSEYMGQQLDDLKQQQEIKTSDYMIDGLSKAAKAQNPAMRKIMLQSLNTQGQKLGLAPFDEDTVKALSTDTGAQAMDQAIGLLKSTSNAAERNAAAKAIVQALGIPYIDALQKVNAMVDSLSSSSNKEAAQGFRSQQLDLQGQNLDLRSKIAENTMARVGQGDKRIGGQAMNQPAIRQSEIALNTARNARALIGDITNGKITDSKNVVNQLTNMLVKIENGGGGGVADRQAARSSTAYSTVEGMLGQISGKPLSTLTKGYLNQIGHEFDTLEKNTVNNYIASTDAALAGIDNKSLEGATVSGPAHDFAKNRRDTFLKGVGYDGTGNRLGAPSQAVHDQQVASGQALQPTDIKRAVNSGSTFEKAQASAQKIGYTLTPEQWKQAGGQ